MTVGKLNILILKLKCCSSTLAYKIADNLTKGGCDESIKLILLNDYIDLLGKYDLTNEELNCLTNDQFKSILQNAIDICELCECGTASIIID